ncbi:MAG: hypothetical protein ACLTXW_03115 [Christensenellales bacterium]|jgi:hypothetical protein|nr:MAG TPA: hypothetical protein [Caudoviricetes sp.]
MNPPAFDSNDTVTLSFQNYEFLVESSIRYCLGRLSYATGWECDILFSTLDKLTERCLAVIERDIAEHLRTAKYTSGYINIPARWHQLLAQIRSEQSHRLADGKK